MVRQQEVRGAVRADDQHPLRATSRRDIGEHVDGGHIRPVQIVEKHDDRFAAGELTQERHELALQTLLRCKCALTADRVHDSALGRSSDLQVPVWSDDAQEIAQRFVAALEQAVERFEYYAEEPRYAYFSGCSNGGRGAFNAAAKYPDEYDGVIAGAPGRNVPGLISGWVRAGLLTPPSAAKMASLYGAELAQCDATDGLADGIISNPRACRFDPATIGCPAGVDNDSCLTDAEIQAVHTIRSDLELANGKLVYSRLGLGNPARGFGVFMPLGPPGSPTVASFGAAYLQYIVYNDPAYDPATYDVDRDLRAVVNVIEGVYDFFRRHCRTRQISQVGQKNDCVARYRGHCGLASRSSAR
jgi:pimeloyl-ACP methyl ester carboxylesterase